MPFYPVFRWPVRPGQPFAPTREPRYETICPEPGLPAASRSPRPTGWRLRVRLLVALLLAGPLLAGGTDFMLGAGGGPFRDRPRSGFGTAQVDHMLDQAPFGLPLGLWGALDVTGHGDRFLGAGPYLALACPGRWEVDLGSGPGWYQDHDGFDLGCNLEFRSTLYLFHRFLGGQRIGAAVSHYSNAGLSRRNTGAESAVVYWSVPWNL